MIGTALFIFPLTTYIGLILLLLAVPLAYESVRRKIKKRVMYVHVHGDGDSNTLFDHKTMKFCLMFSDRYEGHEMDTQQKYALKGDL